MPQENNRKATSFEPRVGIAQLVFGLVYAFVTGVAIIIAFRVLEATGEQPYLQYVFVLLFSCLTIKSFFIYARTKILYNNGVHTVATVESIEAVRGITTVKGFIKLKKGGELLIESRFAGEQVSFELKRFLQEQKTKNLPALVVDENGPHPRGMFVIKTYAGHLDENYKNQLIVDKKK